MKEKQNTESDSIDIKNLYDARKNDLENLKEKLKLSNIVGINGDWGTGKSFLCRMLEDNLQKSGEPSCFIYISVISARSETIQSVIIRELSKLFEANGIISTSSQSLKNFLKSNSYTESIFSFLYGSKNFENILSDFKNDLNKLEQRIFIIFEDLDRIDDADIVRNIFDISFKLVSNPFGEEYNEKSKIKIVYQYSEKRLAEIFSLKNISPKYMKKYIPFDIALSSIDFLENIKKELENFQIQKIENSEKLKLDYFEFLTANKSIPDYIYKRFQYSSSNIFPLLIKTMSIRDVKILLQNVCSALKSDICIKNPRAVITYFTIRHLKPDFFDVFTDRGSILNYRFLCTNNQKLTLRDILFDVDADYSIINAEPVILDTEENFFILRCILAFDYDTRVFFKMPNYIDPSKRQVYKVQQNGFILKNRSIDAVINLLGAQVFNEVGV